MLGSELGSVAGRGRWQCCFGDPVFQGMGEPCEEHQECRSGCCVPNSLNPQRFCTAQTFFLHCSPWHKANGYQCLFHWECQSNCCIQIGHGSMRACTAKTIFLQCVPWRKLKGDLCRSHQECLSQCCIQQVDSGPRRCIPCSRVLAQCVPL
ncbi:leucine-rich colipase-like protein 1 [Heterocephalus glaber]|uniref:Leucine-rich colipase-like protein 1 n=1 Tax=Heterocephalus glaber TaxID=10181 RepID=A0AAX6SW18_HETGA|nr:leucine-rich colipase-like protein 1 [Heterocephalus glaber]